MVAEAEREMCGIVQDFEVGARAIVFTGSFRCLAVFEDDGRWHEVYGDGRPLDVERVVAQV
ncbi:MAG TPA: hypothetical protein VM680_16210 [Verrucomicrobiae bacterium]|nr:hypothetical protein [Verrucomicrobiae bacterium]